MNTHTKQLANKIDYNPSELRKGLAALPLAPRHEPNQVVDFDAVFTPEGQRSALDLGRQLVVGNRGAGKSFWAHAILEPRIREKIADAYRQPMLRRTIAEIGFNGSEKVHKTAANRDQIGAALDSGVSADQIWRTVLIRACSLKEKSTEPDKFGDSLELLRKDSTRYSETLTNADEVLGAKKQVLVVVFDALDRLPGDWKQIRDLTRSLLQLAVNIRSFQNIRLKIFMRPDQFSDAGLFEFPDGSKIKNDSVDLRWTRTELYELLFFELSKASAESSIIALAQREGATVAIPNYPSPSSNHSIEDAQRSLIDIVAGPYLGNNRRTGRVYSWIPLHLADANEDCSPRTFLTAWKVAANHIPPPKDKAIDRLGINEGVRKASTDRLAELSEDYRWVRLVLLPMKGLSVPIDRKELTNAWARGNTIESFKEAAAQGGWLAPIELGESFGGTQDPVAAMIEALKTIGVVEVRSSGKINVPDIFRVEAGIKRKGGVAVPKRKN